MFRAALATAGAHEADVRDAIQEVLHTQGADDFVWEVCFNTVVDEQQVYGLDMLPAPALHPRASREFLRALVAVKLGIGMRKVDLKALDRAYSAAFPHSTPLNVNKKKREPPGWREGQEWRDGRDNMMPTREEKVYLKQGNS